MEETIDLTLPVTTAAPAVARHAIRRYGGNPDVELVVSELVTNAVVHGGPPITMHVVRTRDCLHIEVCDAHPAFGPCSADSRGLRLVEAVTRHWGVSHTIDDGKTVWADVPLQAAKP